MKTEFQKTTGSETLTTPLAWSLLAGLGIGAGSRSSR